MQVGPEDAAVNKPGRLQEMVVVVPVDADKDKTERIAQKDRDQRAQRIEADTVRRLHGTPLWLSPGLRRSGSLFEHLLDRLQARLIRAADQFHRAGVTLPFGNVVPRILALERPDPGHRRPTGAVALDGQARLVMVD